MASTMWGWLPVHFWRAEVRDEPPVIWAVARRGRRVVRRRVGVVNFILGGCGMRSWDLAVVGLVSSVVAGG